MFFSLKRTKKMIMKKKQIQIDMNEKQIKNI